MIEIAKQYSLNELIEELNITGDIIKYTKIVGKNNEVLVIYYLLCLGYHFLHFEGVDDDMKSFIITREPHIPRSTFHSYCKEVF